MMASGEEPVRRLRQVVASGEAELPLPGAGRTWERWSRLASWTADDVSLGRLLEGHTDALAILAEAGLPVPPGALLGVWAAEGSGSAVALEDASSGLRLQGRRAYCSGAGTLTHALLTVRRQEARLLILLDLRSPGLSWEPDSWPAVGMAATDSRTLRLDSVPVSADMLVGGDGFYLRRRGFWLGAMGVAACWWGGALGVAGDVRSAMDHRPPDPHRLAGLAAVAADVRGMRALLRETAACCDDDRGPEELRRLAGILRAQVSQGVDRVLARARAVLGSGPLCHDGTVARRFVDLHIYLSQYRNGAELAELGELLLSGDHDW